MSSTTHQPSVSRAERSRRTSERLIEAHATDDAEARARLLDEVIVLNRGVADAVANRYRGRGVATDDLRQSAYEGLVKAVHRFDPTVRPDLLTYAVPTIRGEVQRWFRDHSWVVRPPRRVQELQRVYHRSIERLTTASGRPPTEEEISADLACTVTELRETVHAFGCFQPPSLDRPVGDAAGTTFGDLLHDDRDDGFAAAEARAALSQVLPTLRERDRRILHLRFVEDRSQQDIGAHLGVTQMQISRMLKSILLTLRTEMTA